MGPELMTSAKKDKQSVVAGAFLIALLFLAFAMPISSYAQCPGSLPTGLDCVASGSNKDITAFSTCANITNNHASAKALMVPINSSTEWSTFRTHLPAGVTSGACGGSLTPLTLAGVKFFSGFETGDGREFSGGVSGIAADFARSGSYSIGGQYNQNGIGNATLGGLSLTTLYTRLYIYVGPSQVGTETRVIDLRNSGSAIIAQLFLTGVGTQNYLRVKYGTGATQTGSDYAISANSWLRIEMKTVVSASAGEVTLLVDGVTAVSGTSLNTGTVPITDAWFYADTTSRTSYLDDLLLDDSQYPGAGRVIARQAGGGTATYNCAVTAYTPYVAQTPLSSTYSYTTNCSTDPGRQSFKINPFSSSTNTSASILLSSITATTAFSTLLYGGSGSTEAIGQSFTPTTNMSLAAIDFAGTVYGTLSDTTYAEITTGSISGATIATSSNHTFAPDLAMSTGLAFMRYNFPTPVALTSGTKYYVRLFRTGSRDTTNRVNYNGAAAPDMYTSGEYYEKNSGTWTQPASYDLDFRVVASSTGTVASSSAVNACKAMMMAKRGSGSTRTFKILKYLNATLTTPVTMALTTTDTFYSETSFWQVAANSYLDTMELGIEKSGGTAGQDGTIEDLWVVCDYQP